MRKVLLVYPEFPPSYWGAKYALEFIGRRSVMPPLGLLTVAALFPPGYDLKVVDMNVHPLQEADLLWADFVFISAMIVQRDSFRTVVERCNKLGKTVVAGGPYPTSFQEEISGVDYFVMGEVEDFFQDFLAKLTAGTAPHITEPARDTKGNFLKPDITKTPAPRYELVDVMLYGSMALQFSRGCPRDCEFCDITKLFGRVPRTKTIDQMLTELDLLYRSGWRGSVFLVDDNFIGNKRNVRRLLPALVEWQDRHNHPFFFYTELDIKLADDPELMQLMADAGFDMVFVGIETPNPEALQRINKGHNVKEGSSQYLLESVRKIQHYGMEVSAGFIVGLDGDKADSFDAQIDFIQRAGIPMAMVGLLSVLKGTKLYERYKQEGRLLEESTGNNVSATLNFVPEMDPAVLLEGYKRVLCTLYDPGLKNYFDRCYSLLKNWNIRSYAGRRVGLTEYMAFLRTLRRQLLSRQGAAYLKFLIRVAWLRRRLLPQAIRLAIMGYHYERITRQQVMVDEFKTFLATERERLQEVLVNLSRRKNERVAEVSFYLDERFAIIRRRYSEINEDFRTAVDEALATFQESIRVQMDQLSHILQRQAPTFV